MIRNKPKRRRRCRSCRQFIEGYGPDVPGWSPKVCGDCCTCTNADTAGRCRECGAWDVDTHGDAAPDFTALEASP